MHQAGDAGSSFDKLLFKLCQWLWAKKHNQRLGSNCLGWYWEQQWTSRIRKTFSGL